MDRTSYTNLAKSWEYVEDHAFSRQSAELNAIRTAAEEAGIPQGCGAGRIAAHAGANVGRLVGDRHRHRFRGGDDAADQRS